MAEGMNDIKMEISTWDTLKREKLMDKDSIHGGQLRKYMMVSG